MITKAQIKEFFLKVELYFLSLSILFVLLLFNTAQIPRCFSETCRFIGWAELARLNIVPILLLVLIFISFCIWVRFNYKYASGGGELPRQITEIEDIRFENLLFFATYLVPLIAFDLTRLRGIVMLFLVLFVIGWIFINTNIFYQNPSLAILGYKIYRVTTKTTANRVVITRDKLQIDDYIFPKQISEKIDFAMKKRDDPRRT